VAGVFEGRLQLGNDVTARDTDAFVALFERDISSFTLRPVWVRRIGGEGADQARGVAFDRADNVIVVGEYEGSDPEVGLRRSAGHDAFVVKYDSAGKVAWASAFGAVGRQVATSVGTDGTSHIYVAGSFEETVPLSTGTLRSSGADDIFVIKLAP
jgi:hypothetical protein